MRRRERLERVLTEQGLVPARVSALGRDAGPVSIPRIRTLRSHPGRFHPAGRADVEAVLRLLGERGSYGLREVLLAPAPERGGGQRLVFGRLLTPGRIVLYDQPSSPWLLRGRLSEREGERLRQAGAELDVQASGHTRIIWPGETLRDFMRFHVLPHEIGHHLMQHYTGKRPARIARTRDHESFAERFAARCRDTLAAIVTQP